MCVTIFSFLVCEKLVHSYQLKPSYNRENFNVVEELNMVAHCPFSDYITLLSLIHI